MSALERISIWATLLPGPIHGETMAVPWGLGCLHLVYWLSSCYGCAVGGCSHFFLPLLAPRASLPVYLDCMAHWRQASCPYISNGFLLSSRQSAVTRSYPPTKWISLFVRNDMTLNLFPFGPFPRSNVHEPMAAP